MTHPADVQMFLNIMGGIMGVLIFLSLAFLLAMIALGIVDGARAFIKHLKFMKWMSRR